MDNIFSILIPTFNRKDLLKETLHSVFNQTFQGPYEIVVVDDGSTDGTWEYLWELKKDKKNLVIERHPQNLGVASARNTLLNLAKGKYLLFLDSDDQLLSQALEKIYQKIQEKAPKVLVLSVFIERGSKRKVKIFPEAPINSFACLKSFLDGVYSDALYVFERDILKEIRVPEKFKVKEDFIIKGLAWSLFESYVLKEPLGIIRDHPHRLRKEAKLYSKVVGDLHVKELFKRLPPEFQSLYNYALAGAYFEIGIKLAQEKIYKEAFKFYLKTLKTSLEFLKKPKFIKKFLKALLLSPFSKSSD